MIVYSPATNEAITSPRGYKPRHCFLMTQLGRPIPKIAIEIRMAISTQLNEREYKPIQERAVTTVADSAKRLQSTFPTVVKAIQSLEGLEMLSETTGKRLGRMYAYGEYVELLAKGTEVL